MDDFVPESAKPVATRESNLIILRRIINLFAVFEIDEIEMRTYKYYIIQISEYRVLMI